MSWVKITTDDIKKTLTKTEYDILANLDKDTTETTIIEDTINYWSNTWRQQCKKNGSIDNREGYVPASLVVHILAQIRYQLWTRIPNSMNPGLDDRRVKESDRADKVFDNITKYAIDDPDVENIDVDPVGIADPYIVIPPQFLD